MQVRSVRFINYRCFDDSGDVPISDFSVFMGRNDGGKSSALLGLYKVLSGNRFDDEDHRAVVRSHAGEQQARSATMEIRVTLADHEGTSSVFRLERTLSAQAKHGPAEQYQTYEACVDEPDLNVVFEDLGLQPLKDLCARFSLEPDGPRGQKATFVAALTDYRATLPTQMAWRPVSFASLRPRLPRAFFYYEENDPNPEMAIKSFLIDYFKNELLDEYRPQLDSIRDQIEAGLNEKAAGMIGVLREYCDTVERVSVELGDRSVSGVDVSRVRITQRGGNDVDWSRIGRGRRREMALAVFCWQQEILGETLRAAADNPDSPDILALFDEPDANLDYEAQRKVTEALTDLSRYQHCQVVVATHSVNLIDSVRLDQVTFFGIPGDATQAGIPWRYSDGDGDTFVAETLTQSLGLTNSVFFNERLFVVVEGDTELRALDLLFPAVAGRTLALTSIYLLNGQNDRQAFDAAAFLRRSGRDVILVVDSDVRTDHNKARIFSDENLRRHRIDPHEDFRMLGDREFEDMFENEVWEEVLNRYFPRHDDQPWKLGEIELLRTSAKFSNAIVDQINRYSREAGSKPKLGNLLARIAVEFSMIPPDLRELINYMVEKAQRGSEWPATTTQ